MKGPHLQVAVLVGMRITALDGVGAISGERPNDAVAAGAMSIADGGQDLYATVEGTQPSCRDPALRSGMLCDLVGLQFPRKFDILICRIREEGEVGHSRESPALDEIGGGPFRSGRSVVLGSRLIRGVRGRGRCGSRSSRPYAQRRWVAPASFLRAPSLQFRADEARSARFLGRSGLRPGRKSARD
jgi:hypothetical protein